MARQKMRNQSKELKYVVFRDQHGREWETTWDTIGLGTTGPKNPKGWRAPVMPPSHCLSEHDDRPKEFTVEYGRWLAENAQHQQRYENELQVWAERYKLPKDHPDVLRTVSTPPMPVDLIRACQAGNKWALGLVPMGQVPPWAEPYRSVFASKAEMPLRQYPDLDQYADLEEAIDPEALGGKKITPKPIPVPIRKAKPAPVAKKPSYFATAKRDANGKVLSRAKSIAELDAEASTQEMVEV